MNSLFADKGDLANIKANVLNISGKRDHIALPCQVEALLDHISSTDKQYVCLPTGHMSIVYGGTAVKQTYPTIEIGLKSVLIKIKIQLAYVSWIFYEK